MLFFFGDIESFEFNDFDLVMEGVDGKGYFLGLGKKDGIFSSFEC